MSKHTDYDVPIEGHVYDGIEELNNPLPKWWLATFYGTIVFAIIYWGYFEVLGGPSTDETLAARMENIESAQVTATEELAAQDDVDATAMMADEAAMALGQEQYAKTCVPCHGENGQGSVGPNLTDKYWIHSQGDVAGILHSIRTGFPEKGMPPWGQIIPQEAHGPVAVYVISLQGTDPPDAKEPQGELVE